MAKDAANVASTAAVEYHTVKVDGINVFYREAGPKDAPVLLLLHGFPTSSQMFRNLIPQLADRYHLIAPDYPGYGQSDMPPMDKFTYSFDNLAKVVDGLTQQLGLTRYALYVQDYGAPIGYRIATAHPECVTAIVVQNGNAYDEGIAGEFWDSAKVYWKDKTVANGAKLRPLFELDATKWQYSEGIRDMKHISPDAWTVDQAYMDRPGNKDIQLEMFYSYGTNPGHYPEWQAYFRKYQPPMLIVWGKNDKIFPPPGAHPYLRDLPKAELHFLDTGHFALEEDSAAIVGYMRPFLAKHLKAAK
ncbi:alpha/beta fold hydrolase [Pseudoduganella sp. FT26W]|uniref:Alpha/beta fold hydrolase n=1 Tax=Duganella aquatilis TaxID=2666082 RepID=A0A844CWV2_9BURK|nr:alpha/beta hydrolase [Duganella aquatilis]MRW84893.1 alpha/beta fold hydrolase [Duganella aquatilis]